MRLGRLPGARRLPGLLRRPRERTAVYQSWNGRFADSPRALFEHLRERDAGLEHVWTLEDRAAPTPPGARRVRADTAAYLAALGGAGLLVANTPLAGHVRKRRGTTYVQTWHGSPLKRIGFDIPALPGRDRYLRHLAHDVAQWDHLVSPSPFATEILRRAFRYEGSVLETGYPRNDLLVAPAGERVRAQVRRELGLAPGASAILYAPTFRDDGSSSFGVAPDELARRLGEGSVVLVRAHSSVAATTRTAPHPGVRDVSAVDDIRELYLAADALVTDYSSVLFDFAVTRRPIVLFLHDLERYRDRMRGFYFDVEEHAPGPVARSADELVAALADLDAVRAAHARRHAAFVARFCPLDDGGASARLADALLGGG